MVGRILKKAWSLAWHIGLTNFLSDEAFTKVLYYCYTGRSLNLASPDDYNQKIQWLKLYNRDVRYVTCADKYAVREYVKEKIGEQYLNKCIGVYECVEDIDFRKLPDRFVLKATHGSGWNIVCADKSTLDWQDAYRKMRRWLKSDFSRVGREWQYRDIKPRIICEAFMEETDGSPLRDYKLFTFRGETKYIAVEFDAPGGQHFINFYDANGIFQATKHLSEPCDASAIHLPGCLEEMKSLARKLAEDFPACRVDFYVLGGKKIVFGELTFTPGKGCNAFIPQTFCDELGGYIDLPSKEGVK